MRIEQLPIAHMTPGMQAHVTALHFGEGLPRKVYIQASLHADEMPGSLAAYYLRQRLSALEAAGQLRTHVVLVPFCNPLGLAQSIAYTHHGRFHLPTGQNFNRLFTLPVAQWLLQDLAQDPPEWQTDAQANEALLRHRLLRVIDAFKPQTNVQSMHQHLLRLSHDADIVLDLHCDNIAVAHLYTTPEGWPHFEPLCRHVGSGCQLLMEPHTSGSAFSEFFLDVWQTVRKHYPDVALTSTRQTATLELRGEYDLRHEDAQRDAQAIVSYLAHHGHIDTPVPPAPPLLNPPHPFAGVFYLPTPCSGVVVYKVKPGDWVKAGQVVADIVDPLQDCITPVHTPHAGLVFALSGARLALGERKLMSISSPVDIGTDGLSP